MNDAFCTSGSSPQAETGQFRQNPPIPPTQTLTISPRRPLNGWNNPKTDAHVARPPDEQDLPALTGAPETDDGHNDFFPPGFKSYSSDEYWEGLAADREEDDPPATSEEYNYLLINWENAYYKWEQGGKIGPEPEAPKLPPETAHHRVLAEDFRDALAAYEANKRAGWNLIKQLQRDIMQEKTTPAGLEKYVDHMISGLSDARKHELARQIDFYSNADVIPTLREQLLKYGNAHFHLLKKTTGPIVEQVMNRLVGEFDFAIDQTERLYVYQNGVYVNSIADADSDDVEVDSASRIVRARTMAILNGWGVPWNKSHGATALEAVSLSICTKKLLSRPSERELNLLNGILDVRRVIDGTGAPTLREHSPNFLSPHRIPVVYDPNATCPNIRQFMSEVQPEDTRYLLAAMAALFMLPYTDLQKAFLNIGAGRNGKGIFMRILREFIGKINCAAISAQQLTENTFAGAQLLNKLANFVNEAPSERLQSSERWKDFIACDGPVSAEYKGIDSFTFTPYARHLYNTNAYPQSRDNTDGYMDRWIVTEFNQRFTPGEEFDAESKVETQLTLSDTEKHVMKADPGLYRRLVTPAELSGLLNWALEWLPKVQNKTGAGFPCSASMMAAKARFRGATDHLALWVEQHAVLKPEAEYRCGQLIANFNAWAAANRLPPMTPQAIGRRLPKLFPQVHKMGSDGERYGGIGPRAMDAPF
jgi:phage/plasmid-associated DNA primase